MSGHYSYSQFLDQLQTLIRSGESGALCGRTDDRHAVQLLLKQGDIVDLRLGVKRGGASIDLIRGIKRCTLRFYAMTNVDVNTQSGIPPSDEIMRKLMTPVAPSETRPTDQAGGAFKAIDPCMAISILEELLHDRLGPIAAMLCEMVVKDAGNISDSVQLNQVLTELAQEIEDPHDAIQFKKEAHKRLLDLTT
jgi:hypothetical protein